METPALHPIFAECLLDEDDLLDRGGREKRVAMTRPFIQDGHVYATDARIAVRTPLTPELAAIYPAAGHPDVASVFRDAMSSALAGDVVPFPRPPTIECPYCGAQTLHDIPEDGLAIPPVRLGPPYALILLRHGVTEFHAADAQRAIYFRVDPDVEGILMPLTPGSVH